MPRLNWLWSLLILAIAAGILLPVSPLYRPVPDVDQSVYLYTSARLLEGQTLYRDVWDHKQPLTYLLYALGLAVSGGSLWGIWTIELVLVTAAGLLAFWLCARLAPRPLAFAAVAAGLLTLVSLMWGYSVEELALPLQVGALACLAGLVTPRRGTRQTLLSLLLGVLLGLTFFLKQSLLAAGLAGCLALALRAVTRRQWTSLLHLLLAAAGFTAVAGITLGWLALSGALRAYWQAAFAFNLTYANLGPVERLSAGLDALEFISGNPGLFLAFGLWAAITGIVLLQCGPWLAQALQKRGFAGGLLAGGGMLIVISLAGELRGGQPGLGLVQSALLIAGGLLAVSGLLLYAPQARLRLAGALRETALLRHLERDEAGRLLGFFLAAGALIFPVTVALIGLSGRNYVYYYIPLVPALMLLLAAASGALREAAGGPQARRAANLLLLGLCAATAYNPLLLLSSGYRAQRNPPAPEIGDFVAANTRPDDTILAWGKYTTYVYYVTGRKAPTRFFYQAAVAEPAYDQAYGVSLQIVSDLQARPPALFLLSLNPDLPPNTSDDLCAQAGDHGLVLNWMCQTYQYQGAVGEFQIYQPKHNAP